MGIFLIVNIYIQDIKYPILIRLGFNYYDSLDAHFDDDYANGVMPVTDRSNFVFLKLYLMIRKAQRKLKNVCNNSIFKGRKKDTAGIRNYKIFGTKIATFTYGHCYYYQGFREPQV